jgi:glycosyltransferase involved in cell wall biosynthesis
MLTRIELGNAKQFIVLSEKEANRLRKLFPKGEIVVTSIPEYEFSTKNIMLKNQARARLDITMDEQVLLFFGIVRPYKGLRYLLEAVKILCSSCPKIHLIVAGEFWEPKSLYDQLIENLELRDHVSIYNYYIPNEEVPVFFSAADLFVAPYVNGTQSGAIKLALGYGLPVVLTNCIMEEQLKDREDIWQAKEHDVTSLSTAIYNALEERSKNQDIHLTKTKTNKDWESFVKILGSL